MGVTMKGGTSGDRFNYLPDISKPFDIQEIQNTANNSGKGPGVDFGTQCSGNREYSEHPPVPQGGSNPVDAGGEPGLPASNSAPADIFKGDMSNG